MRDLFASIPMIEWKIHALPWGAAGIGSDQVNNVMKYFIADSFDEYSSLEKEEGGEAEELSLERKCAWCGKHMGVKAGRPGVTHGICSSCSMVLLEEYRL